MYFEVFDTMFDVRRLVFGTVSTANESFVVVTFLFILPDYTSDLSIVQRLGASLCHCIQTFSSCSVVLDGWSLDFSATKRSKFNLSAMRCWW